MTSCCYRPNPANINFTYVKGKGLIYGGDGCGGVFLIPEVGDYNKATKTGFTIAGRDMPSLTNISDTIGNAFDGAQLMFNNNMRDEEFAAFSTDGSPHEYRMITLINIPYRVLASHKWDTEDQQYKGAVVVLRVAVDVDVVDGSTTTDGYRDVDIINYYPIVYLNASEWKALNSS